MSEWYLVLAPFALLAVLSLFRFIGCQAFGAADNPTVETTPGPGGQPVADYAGTVKADTPVSYWRLQEKQIAEPAPGPTVPNTPVAGGTAKDEMGHNDGTYKAVKVQPPPPPPPPAPPTYTPDSPSAPGSLTLEAPGLLELTGQQSTSLNVDGGYVEVPYSISLKLTSFTVEALVRPEWAAAETGLIRTVIALNTIDVRAATKKAFGFGLFAGPDPGGPPGGPDVWQIWLADGTDFKPIKDPIRSLTQVDFTKTNYLAVTYDDTTKTLNMYVYVPGIDLDSGVGHPLKDVAVAAYSPAADPAQSLLIGMHRPPLGNTFPVYHSFKGRIQEVAVHNKALPIGRVSSHIMAGLNL